MLFGRPFLSFFLFFCDLGYCAVPEFWKRRCNWGERRPPIRIVSVPREDPGSWPFASGGGAEVLVPLHVGTLSVFAEYDEVGPM